ncbi:MULTISPECIES: hypothetical protein [Halomonas]|uniref:hypothetical protein n=1 Tax=Halomonas TaxID=2745 RepID=UPI001C973820|nr:MULTISPECIES: hypothetical protein [Halomonas]MBY6209091.1 hypothetical protein [Halomonas sp. DP3Y7-2]MBY6229247.1 hypothetical protein [Halomonas sp. DP3Y7-1]MCA0917690.1 hypothetical protein [Halomonas denitrificans]
MKVQVLAVAVAPDYYTFAGDVVTAHLDGGSKEYDFGPLEPGDQVTVELMGGVAPIRKATRLEDGTLELVLVQAVGPGHWSESGWMDAGDYDPDGINVEFNPAIDWDGQPKAKTRQGWVNPLKSGSFVA